MAASRFAAYTGERWRAELHRMPAGLEQSGDADPGWSADGGTIYSLRGSPVPPYCPPSGAVERKLYTISSDAWYPGKPEMLGDHLRSGDLAEFFRYDDPDEAHELADRDLSRYLPSKGPPMTNQNMGGMEAPSVRVATGATQVGPLRSANVNSLHSAMKRTSLSHRARTGALKVP